MLLPQAIVKAGINHFGDSLSAMARAAQEHHILGAWLIARAAVADGARADWLSRYMVALHKEGLDVLFWDVRSTEAAVGSKLVTHKGHMHRFLARAGVVMRAARHVLTAKGAIRFWEQLGKPVVIKPVKGTRGRAVAVGLNDAESIAAAFEQAQSGVGALVEEQVYGAEYRFLVVGGEVLAVLGKEPAQVLGNGKDTVRTLVDQKNRVRALNPRLMTSPVRLDEVVLRNLERQGLSKDCVPEAGQQVVLRHEANISMGADTFDATDQVSQRAKAVAAAAVQAFPGLDWAGVDMMLPDPTAEDADVHVIEVNSSPGLGGHHFPMRGQPRDVASAVWQRAFARQTALASKVPHAPLRTATPAPCRLLVEVNGKVQGVGYRKWLRRTALGLGVEGWVRNLPSGQVRAALVGDRTAVEMLLGKMSFGPRRARVSGLSQQPYRKALKRGGFRILKTPKAKD